VIVFGEQPDENLFTFNRCFLCRKDIVLPIAIRVNPLIAGASVLCIDGGGIRGVIPLKFLEILQDRIDLPISILRVFNVIFGTSSGKFRPLCFYYYSPSNVSIGGLIALGLSNGWSINQSIRTFISLATASFRKRRLLLCIPILSQILEFIISLLADCRYPEKHIESALQTAFGAEKSISDLSYVSQNGIHVGIPVASIRGPSLCLFTNYNAVGSRKNPGKFISFGRTSHLRGK
jgi:patatin-like phospholipase/acyl hydrolase